MNGVTAKAKRNVYQNRLGKLLHQLFPDTNIITNARKEAAIQSPNGRLLELDYWIPQLSIAFEYQDPHHYVTTLYGQNPKAVVDAHDNIKLQAVIGRGDTLFVIPCWWDGSIESLIGTIKRERPDLLPQYDDTSNPEIEFNPPEGYFNAQEIPGIGELMLPSFPTSSLLASSEWWISEKYDGVHACWNPVLQKMYSRYGKEFSNNTLLHFSNVELFLEGELWFGRGNFKDLQGIATLSEYDASFNRGFLQYIIFDNPQASLQDLAFEDRIKPLILRTLPHSCIVATSVLCADKERLVRMLDVVVSNGGEGVISRESASAYVSGKSHSLLKFKVLRDSEGLVIDVIQNSRLYSLLSKQGTFTAQLHSNFASRSNEAESEELFSNLPTIGDVVKYQYATLDYDGLPVRARILKTLQTAIPDQADNATKKQSLNDLTQQILFSTVGERKASGHWANNVRDYFEDFAKSRGFDPLDQSAWYKITNREVLKTEGGPAVLKLYGHSMVRALVDTFPDVEFEKNEFAYKNRWQKEETRKAFFDSFAERNNFDPLVPENWYPYTTALFKATNKVGFSLLQYYSSSLINALTEIYPDIGIDKAKFAIMTKYYRQDPANRKRFFDTFASNNDFDPLVPENWYSVSTKDFKSIKGGESMLSYYQGSLIKALQDVYPNVGIQPHLFQAKNHKYWHDKENRRNFFESFVHQTGQPLYPIRSWSGINSFKGTGFMAYYKNSVSRMLADLYPTQSANSSL